MTERWRCFVAVPIGARQRDDLVAATSAWRAASHGEDLRWTDPAGWHLTLAFLGDITPTRAEAVASRLPELVADDRVALAPEAVVAWPRLEEARMIWCRFRAASGIAALHNRVAAGLGVTERRRFRPHLTLARVRDGRTAPLNAPPALEAVELPPSAVDEVVLYRSHQANDGTTYEPLARVAIGMPS